MHIKTGHTVNTHLNSHTRTRTRTHVLIHKHSLSQAEREEELVQYLKGVPAASGLPNPSHRRSLSSSNMIIYKATSSSDENDINVKNTTLDVTRWSMVYPTTKVVLTSLPFPPDSTREGRRSASLASLLTKAYVEPSLRGEDGSGDESASRSSPVGFRDRVPRAPTVMSASDFLSSCKVSAARDMRTCSFLTRVQPRSASYKPFTFPTSRRVVMREASTIRF